MRTPPLAHRPFARATALFLALGAGCTGVIGSRGNGQVANPPGTTVTPDACRDHTVVADSSRAPRLTHAQWENTVQDLLRLPAPSGLSRDFTPDGDYGGDLFVDERLWAAYQQASESLAATIAHDTTAIARLMPADAPASGTARETAFLGEIGRRAYRRPLATDEIARYTQLFDGAAAVFSGRDAFSAGVELTLRALLQSPDFLYRLELTDQATGGLVPLGGYEIASRLSYALWNTMPDDALMTAAAHGDLANATGVRAQVERMLGDTRAHELVRAFHWKYLQLDALPTVAPDMTRIPIFRPSMRDSIAHEFETFVLDLAFTSHGGFAQLMTADYTFANDDIALIYGLQGSFGSDFRRVAMPPERVGILSQSGFLAAHGGAYHPDSIHRGVRMVQDILCVPIGDPPPGVPPLPAEVTNTTNRQRVDAHTGGSACASCHHAHINPLGFAFENFDALGQYRTHESGGLPIDATGSHLIDDQMISYDGPGTLVRAIAASDQGHQCYVRHWVTTLAGRPAAAEDQCIVQRVGAESRGGLPIVELIESILSSPEFRSRPVVN